MVCFTFLSRLISCLPSRLPLLQSFRKDASFLHNIIPLFMFILDYGTFLPLLYLVRSYLVFKPKFNIISPVKYLCILYVALISSSLVLWKHTVYHRIIAFITLYNNLATSFLTILSTSWGKDYVWLIFASVVSTTETSIELILNKSLLN